MSTDASYISLQTPPPPLPPLPPLPPQPLYHSTPIPRQRQRRARRRRTLPPPRLPSVRISEKKQLREWRLEEDQLARRITYLYELVWSRFRLDDKRPFADRWHFMNDAQITLNEEFEKHWQVRKQILAKLKQQWTRPIPASRIPVQSLREYPGYVFVSPQRADAIPFPHGIPLERPSKSPLASPLSPLAYRLSLLDTPYRHR